MQDDPFAVLVQTMMTSTDERHPPVFRIGTVITAEPLTVDVGGTVQGPESLLLTVSLAHKRMIVEVGVADGHTHPAWVISWMPKYEVGDKLLLFPVEYEQRYIILMRVYGL